MQTGSVEASRDILFTGIEDPPVYSPTKLPGLHLTVEGQDKPLYSASSSEWMVLLGKDFDQAFQVYVRDEASRIPEAAFRQVEDASIRAVLIQYSDEKNRGLTGSQLTRRFMSLETASRTGVVDLASYPSVTNPRLAGILTTRG